MNKVPITVCMIAKNEEKFLEECLRRLQKYGFEIIITDTGSTDHTKEIAHKYTNQVYDFPWIDDFSAARNFCASHASNPWILALDCDEFVESIDMKVLRILMQKMPKAAGDIRMKVLIKDKRDEVQYTAEEVIRFYNKNYYRFEGAIHEQITPLSWRENIPVKQRLQTFLMPMDVVHQGYVLSKAEMLKKQQRNLQIIQKALEKQPTDDYLLFQYGQSLYITGDTQGAVLQYEKCLALGSAPELVYVQACIMGLAKGYVEIQRVEDALLLLKKYETQCKIAKYVFLQACIYQDAGQPMKALLYYIKTTTMQDTDTLGVNLLNCYENIITLARRFGNEGIAILYQKQYEECKAEKQRILQTMNIEKDAERKIAAS